MRADWPEESSRIPKLGGNFHFFPGVAAGLLPTEFGIAWAVRFDGRSPELYVGPVGKLESAFED